MKLKERSEKYLINRWLLLKRLADIEKRPQNTELTEEEEAEDWAAILASTQVLKTDNPTAYKQFQWRFASAAKRGFKNP